MPSAGSVLTITLFVPGVLVNPGNARPGHWGSTYRYTYGWRQRTNAAWKIAGRPTWAGPAVVVFTGYTAKLWDDAEGLHGACKAIRDEAVKLILGTDDGPASGHGFVYLNETRPKGERGCLITVEPR